MLSIFRACLPRRKENVLNLALFLGITICGLYVYVGYLPAPSDHQHNGPLNPGGQGTKQPLVVTYDPDNPESYRMSRALYRAVDENAPLHRFFKFIYFVLRATCGPKGKEASVIILVSFP